MEKFLGSRLKKNRVSPDDVELVFDHDWFRSTKVHEHLELYNKIQDLIKEETNCSGLLVYPIVFYAERLWNEVKDPLGGAQEMNMNDNTVVIPSDDHFIRLEKITSRFLNATHEVMKKLVLDRHMNTNLQVKRKRNHFKKGIFHPTFWGVPTTTKLRYSNKAIKF